MVNTTNLKINGFAKSEQVASLGADLIGTNVLRLYSERKQDLFGSSHKWRHTSRGRVSLSGIGLGFFNLMLRPFPCYYLSSVSLLHTALTSRPSYIAGKGAERQIEKTKTYATVYLWHHVQRPKPFIWV